MPQNLRMGAYLSGSKTTGVYIGICHAEFPEAFERCPGKVRSLQFPEIKAKAGSPNDRFQKCFRNQGVSGAQVSTGEEAIEAAKVQNLG
ncbi:MAG TPA: hypothetical protein PLR25_08200 [Planctomycetaceae bacterium]|nr:hypothetical protein [Planctomycetaceae bacterium]